MSKPFPVHGTGFNTPRGLAAAVPGTLGQRMRRGLAGVAMALMAMAAAPVGAQSLGNGSLGGTLAVTSQLVDRGMPVSSSTPVAQAALTWATPSGWSAGVSASSEARSPGRVLEMLGQVAHAWAWSNDWQAQAGVLYYRYNPGATWRSYDRTELGGSLAWRDVVTLGISAAHLSHGGRGGPRLAADLDAHWPLAPHLTLIAGAGWAQYLLLPRAPYGYHDDRSTRYGYGHVGLAWVSGPWRLELKRIGTRNVPRPPGISDLAPWNATAAWSF